MSPEPSIDMFRPNRLRLKFNLENICSKFEKIKECGIEMSLDHPDPHKTTFYIPQGMDPREVSKHKQKFYAVSENFSLAPLSARLNDDEALDFNENLKRKCEKRDREFNECLALTPYAPNETLQPVENKTFRLRETETIRTISTEGVALNELEAYVQSIHPDGEIVFSAVENNVSIIKIRLKKTVSVSSDSQTEQLQITGGESLSENDFEREYRDIQRRSLTQLAIEGPVEKTKNEDENEDAISVRSGIMPFSQQEGQLSERLVDCTEESLNEEDEKDSVHSESVSLKEEIREDSAQPSNTSKTSVPMRKTPARACKSTTNSPATAKSNKNSGLSIRTNTDVQPKGTLRRSPRGVSQTVTPAPLTVARRRSERRTSGLIEPAESFESASQTSLPELFGIDDRVEEELGQRQDVEFDRQSGPIPHSENYFSAPEEVEKNLSDNTQQARKKKRKAKRLTQRKQKRIRPRHSSKVSQTAGSVTSGPIGKDEDGSGTVYDEVYTPEASFRGVQPEPGELTDQKGIDEALFQIPTVSSGRKRPASLLVGVSPVSKRSHQQNNTICPSNEELLSGFWQEDGQSLLNELVKTGPFQSMMGVAKDWLPVYSPIDKPLIDHWAEATVYWKENRSRDFTSGFQDFEGRQLISAAKARNNKMIHGFDCT